MVLLRDETSFILHISDIVGMLYGIVAKFLLKKAMDLLTITVTLIRAYYMETETFC